LSGARGIVARVLGFLQKGGWLRERERLKACLLADRHAGGGSGGAGASGIAEMASPTSVVSTGAAVTKAYVQEALNFCLELRLYKYAAELVRSVCVDASCNACQS
jgi:hypothetical protein